MRLVGTCWNPSACIGPQKHWDFRPQKKIRLKAHWQKFWWGVYPTPPLICGKLYCSVFSNSTIQPISNPHCQSERDAGSQNLAGGLVISFFSWWCIEQLSSSLPYYRTDVTAWISDADLQKRRGIMASHTSTIVSCSAASQNWTGEITGNYPMTLGISAHGFR